MAEAYGKRAEENLIEIAKQKEEKDKQLLHVDLSSNCIAADDNPMKLMSIAMKPGVLPPFPLERIEGMTKLMGGDGELKW